MLTASNQVSSTSGGYPTTRSSRTDQRIPYLDGLRAYSIISVILAHTAGKGWSFVYRFAGPLIANGTLGVRVFFVISGFLITTLLLNEFDRKGSISIRAFYERRVARIFPAFYLYIGIILLCTLVGIMSVPRPVFIAASTFTWNFIHFYRYAVVRDDTVVLSHFWTLSIEEQFYLLWPTTLVLLGLRRSHFFAIAGVFAFPLLRLVAFWGLNTGALQAAIEDRFVQDLLFMGVLAAFAVRAGVLEHFRRIRYRAAVPWLSGLILFVLDPWLLSLQKVGFYGYLVPSLQGIATVLLIFWLLSGEGGILRSILESWPMVQVGILSYSLYIWQQIFMLWVPTRLGWLRFPWNILPAFLVALLCYHFWELPMRKRIRKWFRA